MPIFKELIVLLFSIYKLLLVFKIVLSWMPYNRNHPLIVRLDTITEPYLDLFRQLPFNFSGIDFSPIIAFFALGLLEQIIFQII